MFNLLEKWPPILKFLKKFFETQIEFLEKYPM